MNILLLYYDSLPVGRAALQQGDGFVRRCYYNFEVLCGLRPFYIRYPTDVDEPQLRVSPIGCIAVVAHLVVFISSLVVAILHRKFVDTDNDLQLIDMGSFTLDLLLTINTFNIFVLAFIHRRLMLQIAHIDRLIAVHVHKIAPELNACFDRKCSRLLCVSFVVSLLINVNLYGFQLYANLLSDQDQWYLVFCYTTLSIMPYVYAQWMTISFGVNVMFLKLVLDQLNEVLLRFCDNEKMRSP